MTSHVLTDRLTALSDSEVVAVEMVDSNGTNITFVRSGNPERVPLVLLPGLTQNLGTYADVGDALGDEADVFAMDFRGHGNSGWAPGTYTTQWYVSDAVALIESAVRRPAVVVGHSLGANVAFALAQSRPDLVLAAFCEEPTIFFHEREPREATDLFKLGVPWLRRSMAKWQAGDGSPKRAAYDPSMQSEAIIDSRIASLLSGDPAVCDAFLDGTMYDGYEPDGRVTVALTVLRGDPAVMALFTAEHEARLKCATPLANVIMIPGAGHEIHNMLPTIAIYLEHLRSVLQAAR